MLTDEQLDALERVARGVCTPATVLTLVAEIRRLRPVLAAAEALMGHTERQEYDPRALGALWDAVRTAKEGD